ncbi:hypothetical protein V8C40DRAFT_243753 [Trichoderma camerunense]
MQIKIANLFHLPFFLFSPLLSFVSPLLAVNVFTVPNTLGPQPADSATALAGAFLSSLQTTPAVLQCHRTNR